MLDQEKINDSTSLYLSINKYISETKIKFNTLDEKSEYFDNLIKLDKKDLYITNFRKSFNIISYDDIDVIYISGKKNHHPEIEELNKGIDGKSIKSDIYIKLKNNEFIGFSVKQCNNATKSNYSVQKLFNNKQLNIELTTIKLKYLKENGFTKFNKDKDERDKVNKLFYEDNPYFDRLKEEILIHEEFIGKELYELLYSLKIKHYSVYEFDGTSMYKLNNECQEIISFKEHLPYYLEDNGEKRNTAKLFYQLRIGSKYYRVEIRWKGNVFQASPQYQIHEEKIK